MPRDRVWLGRTRGGDPDLDSSRPLSRAPPRPTSFVMKRPCLYIATSPKSTSKRKDRGRQPLALDELALKSIRAALSW